MTYKNYLKSLGFFLIIIMGISLLNTILYYNDIIGGKISSLIELLTLFVATFTSGFYLGFKSSNKGYINGLILGGIIIGISLLLTLIFKEKLTLVSLFTYILVLAFATFSSILGINRKK